MYSDRKYKVKVEDLSSVRCPAESSDSDSERSYGDRLDSVKKVRRRVDERRMVQTLKEKVSWRECHMHRKEINRMDRTNS